jgi:hypothetical protein
MSQSFVLCGVLYSIGSGDDGHGGGGAVAVIQQPKINTGIYQINVDFD